MSVRPAFLDDMPSAAVVQIICFRVNLPYLPTLHTRDEVVDYFTTHVWQTNKVWVGVEDDMIVGFAAKSDGWLNHLYILPDYQGRGLGLELLAAAMEGEDEMQLWAFQKNAKARRFYERRGFTVVKETDGQDNEEKEPDVLYQWKRQG